MRDGIGSTVIITIIIVFIVFVSSYLAFNVNYTKAFRMKNKIIDLYNDYDGKCLEECNDEIKSYAEKLGYKPASLICPSGTPLPSDKKIYCCEKVFVKNNSATPGVVNDKAQGYYYTIITRINIDIPLVDNIINIPLFNISGDTKVY